MGSSKDSPITSQSYSLSDLLGGELTLVIPDMQRDYCWEGSKVYAYVQTLVQLHLARRTSTLGLFYGYEYPEQSRHIHVIDGQQRITTLYLLLGMLYRRTQQPWLRNLLISDYELIDDHEPRLLYQARSEALYFMSDLVMRFFLKRDGRLSQIEHSDWYYKSYDSEQSIQAFLTAIRSIDQVLEDAQRIDGWDYSCFADYVAHSLRFLYCDLGNRTQAEDVFITINTTGEPLTLSQNLRSLTIANVSQSTTAPWTNPTTQTDVEETPETIASLWTEMEDWFWANREPDMEYSSQNLDQFIDLYARLRQTPTLDCTPAMARGLHGTYLAYRRLSCAIGSCPMDYPTVPCLAYAERFDQAEDLDIQRMWNFFDNIAQYQRPTRADEDLGTEMVAAMPDKDVLSLLQLGHDYDRFLNREERHKLSLLAASGTDRPYLEELIYTAQSLPLLNGRISKVLEWCGESSVQGVIKHLPYYIDAIERLWGYDINRQEGLDDLRRALLAIGHKSYPIVRRGDMVLSMCWNDYDWQRLMQQAPGLIRQVIERTQDHPLDEIAMAYHDTHSPYYLLIKNKELLTHCRKRQLLRPCQAFLGFYDVKSGKTRWLIDNKEARIPNSWNEGRTYGTRCLYTDHRTYNLAVDIYFQSEEKSRFRVELFARPGMSNKDSIDVDALATQCLRNPKYDKKRNRYYVFCPNEASVLTVLNRIFTTVSHYASY